MIFHFGISHKASVQPLFPVLGENCCQFECNQWIFMYVFWANCKTNMDGIIHELLTMNWVCFFTHRNVIQTSATSPKRLSVYWGVSREYTTPCNANLQAAPTCIMSVRPHITCRIHRFLSVTFIYPIQLPILSAQQLFLLPVPFSSAVLLLSTAAASCQSAPHINVTFLGFCQIAPSTILLVILLYRQTNETFQTLLKEHRRGQWTDKLPIQSAR